MKMKLSTKLITTYLLVGLVPLATVGLIGWRVATASLGTVSGQGSTALEHASYEQLRAMRDTKSHQITKYFEERKGDMSVLMETVRTLRQDAFQKLGAVGAIKTKQIQSYFDERMGDLSVLRKNREVAEGLQAFETAFRGQGNSIDGNLLNEDAPTWRAVEERFGSWLSHYAKEYGYYDLFLITRKGEVVYTVAKESDLGANLKSGALKGSPLGQCFRAALSEPTMIDFAPYAPSGNEPCSFIGAPVTDGGETIGVVALQLSLTQINGIMQERRGLGKTGECYLVGPDLRMRSDSYLDPTGHSVKASFAGSVKKNGCDTEAARLALAGTADQKVILDYNGQPVLSCFSPLKLPGGLRWAAICEVDIAEAFAPHVEGESEDFFTRYTKSYGYYDLFLINPDGYCFYTVAKEKDYRSNFVNGAYSASNLGKLVRGVIDSQQLGFADFAPYAPSNNEPCAFIAQPVVVGGKTELVVALQLSLESINYMVQNGSSKEQRLEAYLVGSEGLMRTDSALNGSYSVKNSFASNLRVQTKAVQEALAGKTADGLIPDYNNEMVLSAYAPVDVFGVHYALICEQDEAVAMAAKSEMEKTSGSAEATMVGWILGVAVVSAVVVALVAFFIARGISKPINRIIEGLNEGSDQVAAASGQVSAASQSLAEGATEQAASLEETSSALEEMASMARQNADNSNSANQEVSDTQQQVQEGAKAVENMAKAMGEISESSDKISNIIKTIEEIAFQTNLLALNAAVEAARAGDAGKGFAVVADEVRNLAQRAGQAARDTAELIEGTVTRVKNGTEIVSQLEESFGKVKTSAGKVAQLINEISAASNEQAQGVDQVNTAVAQMDKVTQTNASNAEESASASEELSAQADQMRQVVGQLSEIVGGSATSGHNGHGRKAPARKLATARPARAPQLTHKSDSSGHAIAKPDDVIPMDDDGFKDF